MALVGIMMGSVLGFFGGVAGWLVWDMTALAAFSLYLFTSLATSAVLVLLGTARKPQPACQSPAEAF